MGSGRKGKPNTESGNDRKQAQTRSLSKKWPEIRQQLEMLAQGLSKQRLVKAISILSEARKRRFLRSRKPKYGSMNKAFTEQELELFFRHVHDTKMRLIFSFQATLALRIGEAVRMHIQDINLRTKELRIFTEKSRKTDFLLIPDALFEATMEYIAAHEEEIRQAKGYLFYSLRPGNRKQDTEPFTKTATVRAYFRDVCEKAGLNETYGYRFGDKANALHRLSTHSLRHFSITRFCKRNGGNVLLASKFARHTNLQTTQTYLHVEKEEFYRGIRNSQEAGILSKVRKIQEKI